MFDAQPVEADTYIHKWILDDWPDIESVKILHALHPALRPDARIIFMCVLEVVWRG
jgi:hypothetical protein